MNIHIKHINNTYNYGSCMMATTLIDYINKKIPNVKFYVDTRTKDDLERLKEETGTDNICFDGTQEVNRFYLRIINKIKRFIINKKIDTVIIIGGDDISEYYGKEALEYELDVLNKISMSKNVVLLGQTMGPFTGERKEKARKKLSNTKIYTRDNNCFNYLKDLKFDNISKGRDLAFFDLQNQKRAKDMLNRYSLNKNQYITIVPSGLTKHYCDDYNDYINEQINIISNLLNNKNLEGKKIVLLPHVLRPKSVDDRNIITDIMNRIDNNYCNRIIAIQDKMLPSEAREILGNGIFTITGRMHAAVSTFYMRKPAISLSYSVKYAGVIGDGLDMNDLVIESADEEIWKHCKISELVNEKVEYILDNYENLINKINKNVNSTSKIVQDQLDDLIKKIKETNKI